MLHAVEDEVVVVPARIVLGRWQRGEVAADWLQHRKVERRPCDGFDFAGGDQRGVHRRVVARGQHQHVAEDVARVMTREVPVGMMCEVHAGRGVRRGRHIHLEFVCAGECVNDLRIDVARIALLAVGRAIGERHAWAFRSHTALTGPDNLVESLDAAVEVIRTIVRREGELPSVDGELATSNAIRRSTSGAAEVLRARDILLRTLAPEDHVSNISARVRHLERHDDRPVVGDRCLHALPVSHGPEVNRLAIHGAPVGDAHGAAGRRTGAGCRRRRWT